MEDSVSLRLDRTIRGLQCIDHPCIVRNTDKALATLGGQHELDEALTRSARASNSRQLRLYLNPENPLTKPITADREAGAGLLLSVKMYRRKLKKQDGSAEAEQYETRCELRVIGVIETFYRFRSLCDIQYLPMERTWRSESGAQASASSSHEYRSTVPSFLPLKWIDSSWMSSSQTAEEEVNPVIFPAVFRRLDAFALRFFPGTKGLRLRAELETSKPTEVDNTVAPDPDSLQVQMPDRLPASLWWARRRPAYIRCEFDCSEVPSAPEKVALEIAMLHFGDQDSLDRARTAATNEVLSRRPIWRRDALERRLAKLLRFPRKVHASILLPTVTYTFTDGPFRLLVVRLGYDPRTDPQSKVYQCFNFSLRAIRRSVALAGLQSGRDDAEDDRGIDNDFCIRSDRLPSQNGVYQIGDVKFDFVQNLVHRNDGTESSCTLEHGWLLPDTVDRARKFLRDYYVELERDRASTSKRWFRRDAASTSAAFEEDAALDFSFGDDDSALLVENITLAEDDAQHRQASNADATTKPKRRELPSRHSKTVARSMLSRLGRQEKGGYEEGTASDFGDEGEPIYSDVAHDSLSDAADDVDFV